MLVLCCGGGCRHEVYDTRSDVWSWGVLCVELLTQQKPYTALYATPVQIAIQVGMPGGRAGGARDKCGKSGWLPTSGVAILPTFNCHTAHQQELTWCCLAQVGEGQLHPAIPPNCHPVLARLLSACFDPDPLGRPSFGLIVSQLAHIVDDVARQEAEKQLESSWGSRWWGKATTAAATAAGKASIAAGPLLKRPASTAGRAAAPTVAPT